MQTEFAGTWDRDELKAAIKLARPINPFLMTGLMVLVITALIFFDVGTNPTSDDLITTGVTIAVVLTLVLMTFRYQLNKQLKARWFQGEVSGRVEPQLVSLQTEVSNAELSWARLKKVKANDHAIVLVQQSNVSILLLRNWFKSDQVWEEVVEFCRRQAQRAADGEIPVEPMASEPTPSTQPAIDKNSPGAIAFSGPMTKAELLPVFAQVGLVRQLRRTVIGLAGVLAVSAILLYALGSEPSRLIDNFAPLLIPIAVLSAVVFGIPHLAVNRYMKSTGSSTVEGLVSEQGVQIRVGQSASSTLWPTFTKTIVNNNSVGLAASDQVVMPILRSWFASDDDWQRFVALVEGNVAQR